MSALTDQWAALCHLADRPAPYTESPDVGAIKIPDNISARGRMTLLWCLFGANVDGLITYADLRTLSGYGEDSTKKALAEIEAQGFIRRLTHARPRRIRVCFSRIFRRGWRTCMHCPRPVVHGAPKSLYCATCLATIVRHDREWRTMAFEIWASSSGESDAKVVYRIHARTGQPIFTRRGDAVETGKEGIVNWMIDMGMLKASEWAERMKAHATGEVE